MQNRQQHQREVQSFLQKQFTALAWEFTLPHGYGNETYFAHGNGGTYFVKLHAPIAVYRAMASIGLTPPVLATGWLEDGTSLLVQPYIPGKKPTQSDYRKFLEQIAGIIARMHHSLEVQQILPPAISYQPGVLAFGALACLQTRWEQYKNQVPALAGLIDKSLASLTEQVQGLQGAGAVASHNDICNANWIIASNGQIYIIDLDAMSMDDPACDIGAILWWYYPPELRQRFLEISGYASDEQFRKRMQVRMALHCLSITMPRDNSFDRFDPIQFPHTLTDSLAILAGRDNPQGYNG
jgi:thiamine kinase-like enzyme